MGACCARNDTPAGWLVNLQLDRTKIWLFALLTHAACVLRIAIPHFLGLFCGITANPSHAHEQRPSFIKRPVHKRLPPLPPKFPITFFFTQRMTPSSLAPHVASPLWYCRLRMPHSHLGSPSPFVTRRSPSRYTPRIDSSITTSGMTTCSQCLMKLCVVPSGFVAHLAPKDLYP